MDQFDVLVENYGIKPQGKSAPMASVKSGIKSKTHNSKPANSWSSSSGSKSNVDDHDDPFQFNSGTGFPKQGSGGFGDFDIGFQSPSENVKFGASSGGSGSNFDVESMFRDSMNLGTKPPNSNGFDDLFSGFPGKSSSPVNHDGLLFSTPQNISPVDDLFGNLGGIGSGSGSSVSRSGNGNRRNKFGHEDELIPGFGTATATATNNGTKHVPKIPKPGKKEPQEANFIDIESTSDKGGQYGTNEGGINGWNFQAAAPADAEVDLGSFFTAQSGKSNASVSAATFDVDIDPLFSAPNPNRTSSANMSASNFEADIDPIFGILNPNRTSSSNMSGATFDVDIDPIFSAPNPNRSTRASEEPTPVQKTEVDIGSLFSHSNVKIGAYTRAKPRNQTVPDFDFFGEGSTASADFEEIEGEDDERRRARYESYLRTKARMAKALAEMNSREFKAQQERDERHRIAEIKDSEMKLWAAGKEGNLRALLSSLDQVLWPECGWKALSLTDLITSSQVKLAYKKAALYVHPDKVQQKGATPQQKYVAEKVFDLLKEAWNKFNQEELR